MQLATDAQRASIKARREARKAELAALSAKAKAKEAQRVNDNRAKVAATMNPTIRENRKVQIGIDPAFRKGGIGVCLIHPNGKVEFPRFGTAKQGRGVLELLDWIRFEAPQEAVVTIEDANQQNTTFDKSGGFNVAMRKSRNVGCNQAVSALIVERCLSRWGDSVNAVSPAQKGRKWTKQMLAAVAKSSGHTLPNKFRQDDIDAYQLALKK